MSNIVPCIDKLIGRENYNNWSFAMKAYLEHENLWSCVEGTDPEADEVKKSSRDTKAKSKLIMMVGASNFVHIRSANTAKEVWDKLQQAFQDKGLTRKVGLMRKMIVTKLDDCSSMEDYVNTIITTAQMLNDIGFIVSDEWVGTFLLAGLPEAYKPMIMAIENSNTNVTGDYVKTKLLQEVKCNVDNEDKAFFSDNKHGKKGKNKSKKRFTPRCFNCNDILWSFF